MSAALIIFAKTPRPGAVKTRLQPVVSPEEAARLYTAFLRDIFARCDRLTAALRVYVAPPYEAFPRNLLPEHATLHEQQGSGLGARMHRAFAETFDAGFDRAVIIGTDQPTLRVSTVESALTSVAGSGRDRVAVGPSVDGGYYLLGLAAPCPDLFDMTYSHGDVLAQTMRAIEAANRLPVLLREAYDIDRPADLRRLVKELRVHPERASYTAEALQEMDAVRV